jgi:hypothetical protein
MNAACSGSGSGSATRAACSDQVFNTGSSKLPDWVMTNRWYDYFYYVTSRDGPQLTIGTKSNVDVLLVGTGRSIIAPDSAASKAPGSSQSRPSCSLNDYLDSIENTNVDAVFDSITLTRTRNYNDHSYIVAP